MKKILIIEDDELLLKMLSDRLKEKGYQVIQSKNGQEGVSDAIANRPDVIILDILMPVMTGIEVLEKLRQDAWGKDVPVIVTTNMTDTENISEAMKYRIFQYMVKGKGDSDAVVDAIHRILNDKKS